MTIAQIVLLILTIGSFYEYNVTRNDKIRHNEKVWLAIAMALSGILLYTILFDI